MGCYDEVLKAMCKYVAKSDTCIFKNQDCDQCILHGSCNNKEKLFELVKKLEVKQ